MKTCGIRFPRQCIKDAKGCILPINHTGEHVCMDANGKKIDWDFDYSCQCGCWDDLDHEWDCGCIIYKYHKPLNQ